MRVKPHRLFWSVMDSILQLRRVSNLAHQTGYEATFLRFLNDRFHTLKTELKNLGDSEKIRDEGCQNRKCIYETVSGNGLFN